MSAVVYEKQKTDIAWYANAIPNGTASNNFDRILELRKAFCHPLTINKDGTLNKKYFSNKTKETAMNWSDIELLQLYQGIYRHGVDNVEKWIKIQSDFLPQRDFIEVRLKLSQLFGVQDLGKYKDRIFKSEKEVNDEFEKNKKESKESGDWSKECNVALKPEIMALTDEEINKLKEKELAEWKKHIYDNPSYIYRTNGGNDNNRKRSQNKQNKQNKTNKKSAKPSNKKQPQKQKNTIDQMLRKQTEKANDDKMEQDEVRQPPKLEKPKKKQNKKKNKKPAKQNLPLMPEDSEDEEMLCVE